MTVMKEYCYRLIIRNKIAVEGVIEQSNPKEALDWGFYWIPNLWAPCDHSEPVRAQVRLKEPINNWGWKSYSTPILEDVGHISDLTTHDLECLLAGQDLVWRIGFSDPAGGCNDRLFRSYSDCKDYIGEMNLDIKGCYPVPTWVDGWYDEQLSWKRDGPPKGYTIKEGWQ